MFRVRRGGFGLSNIGRKKQTCLSLSQHQWPQHTPSKTNTEPAHDGFQKRSPFVPFRKSNQLIFRSKHAESLRSTILKHLDLVQAAMSTVTPPKFNIATEK